MTNKMELYCQSRANGLNQAESYLIAYPTSKNWTESALYARASETEKRADIKKRIEKLKKPQQDLLEKKRTDITKKLIDIALNDKKVNTTTVAALSKLIDKLLPTKTENKNDVQHVFNITFDV